MMSQYCPISKIFLDELLKTVVRIFPGSRLRSLVTGLIFYKEIMKTTVLSGPRI